MILFGFVTDKLDNSFFCRFKSKNEGKYIQAEFDFDKLSKEDLSILSEGLPIVWNVEEKKLDIIQIKMKD